MKFKISEITTTDQDKILKTARKLWGDQTIIVHGNSYDLAKLPGFKATLASEIQGFLHYQIRGSEFEVLSLASLKEGQGIGSALLQAAEKLARENSCENIALTTTNDNLKALGFYQRRGYYLSALYPGEIIKSRKIKPSIPEIGSNKIPVRDELVLNKSLE